MPPPPSPAASRPRFRWLLVAAAALALAYACGHLGWYLGTPLGRVAVLDERENLALAAQIAAGTLPPEPFYRAMGYPLVLAGLLRSGLAATEAQWMAEALALGALLHAFNALLAGFAAQRLFRDPRAGLATTLLLGFHPVLLHYATQVLDATLASTLFLLGLLGLVAARAGGWRVAAAGMAWAAAALTRPQFLPVFLALPLAAWLRTRSRAALGWSAAGLAAGGALFLAQGLWQNNVSGAFRVLPWQGAYNLWAANKPGAHGRYFTQSVFVAGGTADHENPTKLESLALYERETGRVAARDGIEAVNAHWRARFLARVRDDPLGWLGQLARRGYALLNNWEHYNNKTYAFHAARSPWLRANPLGWGVLLVLGAAGAWLLWRRGRDAGEADASRALAALGAIATLYAASVLLFFVSARFRLPLVIVLGIAAGGALAGAREILAAPRRQRLGLALLLAACAGVAYSNFDGVRDPRTFLQDHLLLARAAQRVGDDALALAESRAACALAPRQPEAAELLVTSWHNATLASAARPAPPTEVLAAARVLRADAALVAPASVALAEKILREAP
jgi:hypothetical protein